MALNKLALATSLLCFATVASAQVYDLEKDFSLKANPSGTWSFGGSDEATGFEAFTNNVKVGELYVSQGRMGLVGWSRPDDPFPFVGTNQTQTTMFQRWHSSDVVLCPGRKGYAIARWTNPRPGTTSAKLSVTFRRIEDITGNVSDWYVVVNGVVVESGTLSLGSELASVANTYTLRQGGTIALVAGYKVSPDGTCLSAIASIVAKSK